MKKTKFKDRLHYAFDNFMSKGTISLIGGLALVSLIFIVANAILITIAGITDPNEKPYNLAEAIWGVLMRTLDTGTVGADIGWISRLFMLFVTFGGIFIISTLIGLLSSGIEAKLQDLRKGRSRVIEDDHIVILGWSFQIFTLLSELLVANANHPERVIVILSEEDKVEMEEKLQKWLNFKYTNRIVCRTGQSTDLGDLGLINIQNSRSIIILNPPSEYGDIHVIKTLLGIMNIPRDDDKPYHIVAEIQEGKTLDIVKIIAGDQVETLLTNDIISKIIVQTCRQSGLSSVYMDLFDFSGNEIYVLPESTLVGKTYGEILLAYNNAAVIGIKNEQGEIEINPKQDRILSPQEDVILLAEDDDTAQVSPLTSSIEEISIQTIPPETPHPEHTLILGWNLKVPTMIKQLDEYVVPQSSVTVMANLPEDETIASLNSADLVNQSLSYYQGDPTERLLLENLKLDKYDQILLTASDYLAPDLADSQTLVSLLQLRNLTKNSDKLQPIITEMLDARNQELASIAKPDDFVISERILSLLMAQIAETKTLNQVFQNLLTSEGSEIYLKPINHYIITDKPVNFYTVVESAKRKNESAIGYRIKVDANNKAKNYGIMLNPCKSDLIKFKPEDKIIVLAEF
jgi:ion channel POLLUX/CASTOR